MANHISDLLVREVKQVAQIEKANDMRRLLSVLATDAGGLATYSRLASELEITAPTVKSYVEILEAIFMVRLVPAWSSNPDNTRHRYAEGHLH